MSTTNNSINNTIGSVSNNTILNQLRAASGQWQQYFDQTDTHGYYSGSGSPEGVVAADIGSRYSDTTAGNLYIKQTDTVNTGWVQLATATTPMIYPGVVNIGVAYSGGTFTVQGADGTALSASNPGYVTLQSKSVPGQLVTIPVTANQTFTDGAAGTTDNARFGLTTGVNWSADIPFFLYGVMDDTESLINFMISRNPAAKQSPAAASISKTGAIINVGTGDFFSLGNITVADYDSNPALCIGSFRMQFVGATDSWTVTTLDIGDGIGQFNNNRDFSLPAGVNGAAASTYIINNAGTEPQFTAQIARYRIMNNGMVDYRLSLTQVNVAGVGAQTVQFVLPYTFNGVAQDTAQIHGYYLDSSTGFYLAPIGGIDNGNSFVSSVQFASNTGSASNAIFAANDSIFLHVFYPAYNDN